MKQLIKALAIFDGTNNLLALLGGVLVAFVMLIVCAEVVMRYFVGRSIIWVFEVTEYSLLFMTFLAAAWLLKKEGHVSIDLLLNRLSPKPRAMVNIITSIIGAIVCLVVAWYGSVVTVELLQQGEHQATIVEPPSFILYVVIPVGSFLLFVQFLRRAYGYLGNWRDSRK